MSEKVFDYILIMLFNIFVYVTGFAAGYYHGCDKCREKFREDTEWLHRYMGWVNGLLGQDMDAGPEKEGQDG